MPKKKTSNKFGIKPFPAKSMRGQALNGPGSNSIDFEASLEELESIVDKIEEGGLSLEESLKLFEKGVGLTKDCQKAIKNAEQKVKILTGEKLSDFKLDLEEDGDDEE